MLENYRNQEDIYSSELSEKIFEDIKELFSDSNEEERRLGQGKNQGIQEVPMKKQVPKKKMSLEKKEVPQEKQEDVFRESENKKVPIHPPKKILADISGSARVDPSQTQGESKKTLELLIEKASDVTLDELYKPTSLLENEEINLKNSIDSLWKEGRKVENYTDKYVDQLFENSFASISEEQKLDQLKHIDQANYLKFGFQSLLINIDAIMVNLPKVLENEIRINQFNMADIYVATTETFNLVRSRLKVLKEFVNVVEDVNLLDIKIYQKYSHYLVVYLNCLRKKLGLGKQNRSLMAFSESWEDYVIARATVKNILKLYAQRDSKFTIPSACNHEVMRYQDGKFNLVLLELKNKCLEKGMNADRIYEVLTRYLNFWKDYNQEIIVRLVSR